MKMANKGLISIRLNAEEKTVLEVQMRKEGWESVSGYFKYKALGINPERKVKEMIERKDTDDIVILLKNEILDLAEHFNYFRMRYEKDMNQLWTEEGTNEKTWAAATNRWHVEALKKANEVFMWVQKIAEALGLEQYFINKSDEMAKNGASDDEIAKQLHLELIAKGRGDIMER